MATEKVTVTFDPHLLEMMRASAEREGLSLSGWLAAAARNRLREQGARELAEWLATDAEGQDLMALALASSRRVISQLDEREQAA